MEIKKALFAFFRPKTARKNKLIAEFLVTLPRCSKYVELFTQDKHSVCLVVSVADLLPVAQRYASSKSLWGERQDVVARAAPIWLQNADLTNDSITKLQPEIGSQLRGSNYPGYYVTQSLAKIFCVSCDKFEDKIQVDKSATKLPFYVEQWFCSNGHELYRFEETALVHYISR